VIVLVTITTIVTARKRNGLVLASCRSRSGRSLVIGEHIVTT